MRLEHAGRDDVDRMPEQPLQLEIECGEIEQIRPRLQVDEQVNVAAVIVRAAYHAPEHADPGDVVRPGQLDNLAAVLGEQVAESRRRLEVPSLVGLDRPRVEIFSHASMLSVSAVGERRLFL